jgi:hypothetical protein
LPRKLAILSAWRGTAVVLRRRCERGLL